MNPNSEIIFSFNTMTAKNRKGGTQLVLRNAENNQEIASTDIQGGGVYRLFKLPDNVQVKSSISTYERNTLRF